jgi:DNA-binding NarL/FixJ family response regulator
VKRLLLVDDHDLFRQVLAVILEQHTDLKENLQAGSLAEAHQILDELEREEEVDLAVVDLDLPEGDATQLIEDLRELEVPVLALTSSMSLERRTSALRAGAGEVLTTAACGEKIVGTARRLINGQPAPPTSPRG